MSDSLRYISLGAGVQSSALLVLSALGGCDKADVAIFADTQREPRYVYEQVKRLEIFGLAHGIPVVTVTAGDLGAKAKSKSGGGIPAFTLSASGSKGMLRRKCTRDFKIVPIQREVKRLLGGLRGVRSGRSAVAMIGISREEATRMKPSLVPWIRNTYPLVDLGLRKHDCIGIVTGVGMPEPQKSSCYFCPYSSDRRWLYLRDHHPQDFADAVRFDAEIRHRPQSGIRDASYLHSSVVPLSEVRFRHDGQRDLFQNECEGMCGV